MFKSLLNWENVFIVPLNCSQVKPNDNQRKIVSDAFKYVQCVLKKWGKTRMIYLDCISIRSHFLNCL